MLYCNRSKERNRKHLTPPPQGGGTGGNKVTPKVLTFKKMRDSEHLADYLENIVGADIGNDWIIKSIAGYEFVPRDGGDGHNLEVTVEVEKK